jgi:hypothetical protein
VRSLAEQGEGPLLAQLRPIIAAAPAPQFPVPHVACWLLLSLERRHRQPELGPAPGSGRAGIKARPSRAAEAELPGPRALLAWAAARLAVLFLGLDLCAQAAASLSGPGGSEPPRRLGGTPG